MTLNREIKANLCTAGILLTERIVMIGHNVGESVGNVPAGDDSLGLASLVR
jgi:hypothetical protein